MKGIINLKLKNFEKCLVHVLCFKNKNYDTALHLFLRKFTVERVILYLYMQDILVLIKSKKLSITLQLCLFKK